jgi:hypothetical protein
MSAVPHAHPLRDRRGVPFEVHRVAEYLLGFGLASVALDVTGSLAALVAGLAVIVPALITKGRLGVVRWCSPGMHRDALARSPVGWCGPRVRPSRRTIERLTLCSNRFTEE